MASLVTIAVIKTHTEAPLIIAKGDEVGHEGLRSESLGQHRPCPHKAGEPPGFLDPRHPT
jgi:hypothetical protein